MIIPKANHSPSQESIDEFINKQLVAHAGTEDVTTGTVANDSTLNIDYVGSVDGVEFEGGNTNGEGTVVTIGVTPYIPGFLEQLVGKEVGSTFDINVTFPEDYQMKDLAGKDAVFKITINSIQVPADIPEFTDDFVKENFSHIGYETKEQFTEYVTEMLSHNLLSEYLYNEIIAKTEIEEICENALNFHKDHSLAFVELQAKTYGTTIDAFLQANGFDSKEEFLKAGSKAIESDAKQLMVLQAIAKQENLTVSDKDIKESIGDNADEVEKLYGKNYIKMSVLREKAITFLEELPKE